MDNPNITMEEYIRLEEEKAHRHGKVYNWETAKYDMTPLPPHEQRHPFLRYQGLEYSDRNIADFEERLERIYDRDTYRVQVLDFEGMPELMRDVLYARMLMEHRDDDGVVVFTREEIESPEFARTSPSYTSIRDPMLRLFHRMMTHSIAGRSQAPKKVTVTDLFYLRGLDVGSVNIPYLLARYLRRFAAGRKSGDLISVGQFIYVELIDTWAWVPAGPARQEGDAGGVSEEALRAPEGGDEDEEMPQTGQREVLYNMACDFSRFTTWIVTSLSRIMDKADVTYTRYFESPVEYQRCNIRQRTDEPSTSVAPQQHDP
ncbi:hypothetical protein Tco_0085364 [Tanacetum coccineum]